MRVRVVCAKDAGLLTAWLAHQRRTVRHAQAGCKFIPLQAVHHSVFHRVRQAIKDR